MSTSRSTLTFRFTFTLLTFRFTFTLLTLRFTFTLLTLRFAFTLLTLRFAFTLLKLRSALPALRFTLAPPPRLTLLRAPRCPNSVTPPSSSSAIVAGTRVWRAIDPDIVGLLIVRPRPPDWRQTRFVARPSAERR